MIRGAGVQDLDIRADEITPRSRSGRNVQRLNATKPHFVQIANGCICGMGFRCTGPHLSRKLPLTAEESGIRGG
ncbi:hypothetical protein [Gemmobacter serpentinus]|uniref:hypothetical protein n=1 Tax=Gemmobacter serpentinus TaxID=2652247 RepID=UPI0018657722|nr:hypothetical protein [Gemmobacter serpentinus]